MTVSALGCEGFRLLRVPAPDVLRDVAEDFGFASLALK
jgi:hypothetical protein